MDKYFIVVNNRKHYGTREWCEKVSEEIFNKTRILVGISKVEEK